jgi:uncharacterized DUF497 family protein
MMHFEWDPTKAASNAAKHGVTFEEATEVFANGVVAMDIEDHIGTAHTSRVGYALVQSLAVSCWSSGRRGSREWFGSSVRVSRAVSSERFTASGQKDRP